MNMFGTMGYAAPEALGYHDDSDDTITYTMSVDIWAVGIIALTLLLGRDVFTHQWDFWRYVNQQKPLDFSREQGEELTDTCREFVTRMLAPDPIVRPTVISVLAHPWLKEADTSPPVEVEMHDDQETGRGDGSPPQDAPRIKPEPEPDNTPGMIPETEQQTQLDINLTVVKQEETKPELKLYPPRDPIELQRIHNFLALDSILLSPKFRGILLDQVYQNSHLNPKTPNP